jgi:hypothetical protein
MNSSNGLNTKMLNLFVWRLFFQRRSPIKLRYSERAIVDEYVITIYDSNEEEELPVVQTPIKEFPFVDASVIAPSADANQRSRRPALKKGPLKLIKVPKDRLR